MVGLDVLLDTDGKAHLLEINLLPDLRSETPLLSTLVSKMMSQMFDIVGMLIKRN